MRRYIFWIILMATYAFASISAYLVQPDGRSLALYQVLSSNLESQRDLVVTQFDADWDLNQVSAILAPAHYGTLKMRLNGNNLEQVPLRQHQQISRYHSLFEVDVPKGMLKPSGNRLEVMRQGSMRHVDMPDVFVGPQSLLHAYADHQVALLKWVDRATLIVIILGLCVTAALLFFSRRIPHYAFFFLTFALVLPLEFREHITIFAHPILSYMTYIGLIYLILSALSLSYWIDVAPRERKLALVLGGFSLTIVAGLDLIWGLDSASTVFARVSLFVVCGFAMAIWMFWHLAKKLKAMSQILVVIFAFAAAFTLAYLIALITLFGEVDAHTRLFLVCLTNIAEVTAFIGLLTTAAFHEFNAYRKELANNARLTQIVSGRVLRLDAEAQDLKSKIENKAVSQERQRFTRDIHDGIGGQLLSLLLKARNGTLTPDQAETELSGSIADLRLITAALDSSEDGLAAALQSFKFRAIDQLSASGMKLDWQVDARLNDIALDPRQVLELLRWLQEGVTNAVRHSHGTRVTVTCQIAEDGSMFVLNLSDNGCGMANTSKSAGRGLTNMASRARKLGGTFSVSSNEPALGSGTRLILSFPIMEFGVAP